MQGTTFTLPTVFCSNKTFQFSSDVSILIRRFNFNFYSIMKSGLTFILNLVVLVVGVLLIALSRQADSVHTLIFLAGIAFIIPGIINAFAIARQGHRSEENPSGRTSVSRIAGFLSCGGAIILGLTMCFDADLFRSLFVYIFALLLVVGAIIHFYMILRGMRPVKFPTWIIAGPILMIVGALCMILIGDLHRPGYQSTAILITGLGCIVYAITTFIELVSARGYWRRQREIQKAQAQAQADVVDVDHQIIK